MIITTTNCVEGKNIVEYKGIVFGEVVAGVNFIKDFGAGLRNIFGGRSKGYEDELQSAREESIKEMKERAKSLGANAIVSIQMNYEALGPSGDMLMVTCSGTAVVIN